MTRDLPHRRLRALAALAACVLVAGCGAAPLCAPGATQACLCAGGVPGAQVCAADAARWDLCECVAKPAKTIEPPELIARPAEAAPEEPLANEQECDGAFEKMVDLELEGRNDEVAKLTRQMLQGTKREFLRECTGKATRREVKCLLDARNKADFEACE